MHSISYIYIANNILYRAEDWDGRIRIKDELPIQKGNEDLNLSDVLNNMTYTPQAARELSLEPLKTIKLESNSQLGHYLRITKKVIHPLTLIRDWESV